MRGTPTEQSRISWVRESQEARAPRAQGCEKKLATCGGGGLQEPPPFPAGHSDLWVLLPSEEPVTDPASPSFRIPQVGLPHSVRNPRGGNRGYGWNWGSGFKVVEAWLPKPRCSLDPVQYRRLSRALTHHDPGLETQANPSP